MKKRRIVVKVGTSTLTNELGNSDLRNMEKLAQVLAEDLPAVAAMPGGKEYYWEQVPMAVLKEKYKVAIRPCLAEDIQEIDTFSELKALDPSYENYGGAV